MAAAHPCRAVEKDTESVNVDKLNDETKQILQALGTDAAKEGAHDDVTFVKGFLVRFAVPAL